MATKLPASEEIHVTNDGVTVDGYDISFWLKPDSIRINHDPDGYPSVSVTLAAHRVIADVGTAHETHPIAGMRLTTAEVF